MFNLINYIKSFFVVNESTGWFTNCDICNKKLDNNTNADSLNGHVGPFDFAAEFCSTHTEAEISDLMFRLYDDNIRYVLKHP